MPLTRHLTVSTSQLPGREEESVATFFVYTVGVDSLNEELRDLFRGEPVLYRIEVLEFLLFGRLGAWDDFVQLWRVVSREVGIDQELELWVFSVEI